MINSIEAYRSAGESAANARNKKDSALAQHHHNWFYRARKLESEEDRREADKAFNDGYSGNRIIGRPEYFS